MESATYPALSSFLSAYLHEDFVLEHRTPSLAMAAFCLKASDGERRALRQDCERFLGRDQGLAVEGREGRDARPRRLLGAALAVGARSGVRRRGRGGASVGVSVEPARIIQA